MDIAISHPAFAGRGLTLRSAGFLSGPRILIDGAPAPKRWRTFTVRDNLGNDVRIRLKSNGIDPIPKVEIAGETLQLARPLTWYESLWAGLPVLLVVGGGGAGVLIGLTAIYANFRLLRGDRSTLAKYALSGLMSVAAAIAFIIVAVAVHLAVYGRAR